MEKNKVQELWFIAIIKFIKDNGKMIKNMEKDMKNFQMVLFIKDNILMENLKDQES